jgi:hypothetical protein
MNRLFYFLENFTKPPKLSHVLKVLLKLKKFYLRAMNFQLSHSVIVFR